MQLIVRAWFTLMALDRKDVRFKLDPEDHERLDIVRKHDEKDLGEWVEQLVLRELASREAAARKQSSLVTALDSVGISGKSRESQAEPLK